MKSLKASAVAIASGLLFVPTGQAQNSSPQDLGAAPMSLSQTNMPRAFHGFHLPPSAPAHFLASEEGRAFLKATGHPLARYAIAAFGEPSKTTAVPARWLRQAADAPGAPSAPAAVSCTGDSGARFNLEPRVNAVPQNQPTADFLPNRLSPGNDLIVQAANDWRGNLAKDTHWDQSVSGYYVHRSATADCSTQFEGGLPRLTIQGVAQFGIGGTVVAADPERDAIFMADQRFGSLSGVGLFRASASTLLDAAKCPSGSHSEAQAVSCWTAAPPAFVLSQPGPDLGGAQPSIVVDERATGAGKGAGDVYVAGTEPNSSLQISSIALVACSNLLNCGEGAGVLISGSDAAVSFPYVRVRSDGVVTVSYINANTDGSADIKFVACIPAGAPKAPVCAAPNVVRHLVQPIAAGFNVLNDLVNINLIAFTYAKHANRSEPGGKFTSFVVYDDCRNPFMQGNPPFTVCLNAEVLMTASGDEGKTWSTPVSVDTATGHHFYPAITADPSTGIINIAYYSTEGDRFNHEVRVFRSQINPGRTAAGTPQMVTKILDPIDGDPDGLGALQSDVFMGVVARGNGAMGTSRLYISFDSTAAKGTYEGAEVPELNNSIVQTTF